MRILHATGDWKWTGPAEPMLLLLLAQRAAGHAAQLACPEPPAGEPGVATRARDRGVEPVCRFSRGRGARLLRDLPDVGRLRATLAANPPDVLHVWHTRDHALAARARGSATRPRIVRSCARAERIVRHPGSRWLFARADALLFPSRASAEANADLCAGPVRSALGAVDLARFRPRPPDPALRAALGLSLRHRVVGIVARVQRQRRFDLLLEAAALLAARDPDARLLVVGRGTHLDRVAREPARRLGIADRVVFAGHRSADYADVLRAMDVFTYLVPGSDGTCRALLEAQACGLPAVVTRRGALPEIVTEGRTGLVVDEDPRVLCAAWIALLTDPGRRARIGAEARARAERLFRPERLAGEVLSLYREAGAV